MKRKLMAALALLLVMSFASALADGILLQPLSLKEKIQQAKDRSYLSLESRPEIVRPGKTSGTGLPSVFEMPGGDDFRLGTVKHHDTYSIVNFKADDPNKMDFAQAYVDVLAEEYGYRIIHDESRKSTGYRHTEWYMEHPDSSVKSSDIYEDNGRECDVLIVLNQYFEDGDCTLAVYHVNALSHPDTGNASSGGSSGSRKSDCAYCNNGSCNNCGGSGWLSTWSGTERVKQDCPMCIGGRCTRC